MIRVLIISHSSTLPTGMAEIVRNIFVPLLEAYGDVYHVIQLALKHVHAVTTPKWLLIPTMTNRRSDGAIDLDPTDLNGEHSAYEVSDWFRPDIIVAINDPQHLVFLAKHRPQSNPALILYTTIDAQPCPSEYAVLAQCDCLFITSEYGTNAWNEIRPTPIGRRATALYPPHDKMRFQPILPSEKRCLREELMPDNMPKDAFILGWVGLNQWRKQTWILWPIIHYLRTGRYWVCNRCGHVQLMPESSDMMLPVAEVMGCEMALKLSSSWCPWCEASTVEEAQPLTNIVLWCHMPREDMTDTWPLAVLNRWYGVRENHDVWFTKGYCYRAGLDPDSMPMLYQLWDVLLYLSGGEGFGMPVWEAMGVGLPIVFSNHSAHAELVSFANAGLPVEGNLQPEPGTGLFRFVSDFGAAIQAVRQLYYQPGLRQQLGSNGVTWTNKYASNIRSEEWHRILQSVIANRR